MRNIEHNIQRAIVDYINAGHGAAWLNEIPQGMISKHSPTGYRRAANRKTPDIVGVLKDGRGIFIEVKTEKDRAKVSALWQGLCKGDYTAYSRCSDKHIRAQADCLLWLREHGAGDRAMFAFSVEDVIKAISGLKLKIEELAGKV